VGGAPSKVGRGAGSEAHEVALIVQMRKKGRTFSYIAEEIGVCRDVIGAN
jgi:hypothetical protein